MIIPQTIDEIVEKILNYKEGTKIQIIAPVVRAKKGEYRQVLQSFLKDGFIRARIDGEIYNLEEDVI